MTHPFELTHQIEVPAPPEEVWEASATGSGVDAWFMGVNEVEPRPHWVVESECDLRVGSEWIIRFGPSSAPYVEPSSTPWLGHTASSTRRPPSGRMDRTSNR